MLPMSFLLLVLVAKGSMAKAPSAAGDARNMVWPEARRQQRLGIRGREGTGKPRVGEDVRVPSAVKLATLCWLERIPAGRQRPARTSRVRGWLLFSLRRSEHAGGAWWRSSQRSRVSLFRFRRVERITRVRSKILSIEVEEELPLQSETTLDAHPWPTCCVVHSPMKLLREEETCPLLARQRRRPQQKKRMWVSRAHRLEVDPDLDLFPISLISSFLILQCGSDMSPV
jgi:hypothetical protein